MEFITSPDRLGKLFGTTHEVAIRKELPRIDPHSRRFIEKSPFVFIGSQDGNGNADVSPKGDLPGFVHVLDDRTLAVPDRPGNNRLDTWKNIIGNPAVGLIFLIPGMNETLRINGEARLTSDPDLCAQMHVNNRPALAVMVVKVHQVYMHCAKAFIRSKLWTPETWPERKNMPTLGTILKDQAELSATAEEFDVILDDAYRKTLW